MKLKEAIDVVTEAGDSGLALVVVLVPVRLGTGVELLDDHVAEVGDSAVLRVDLGHCVPCWVEAEAPALACHELADLLRARFMLKPTAWFKVRRLCLMGIS